MEKENINSFEAKFEEEFLEETQRQKSIIKILLSEDEAVFELNKAENNKVLLKVNPAFS